MADVIEFKRPEPSDPHGSGEAFCLSCGHEWVAVAPAGETRFECPECHAVKGLYKFEFAPPHDKIWTCPCGNQLFNMTPDGHFCPNCARYQEY